MDIVALALVWLVSGVVAAATTLDPRVLGAVAVACAPAGLAAAAAAALCIRPVDSETGGFFVPDELAGPRMLYQLGWPPALASAGVLTILAARSAIVKGLPMAPGMPSATIGISALAAGATIWLRYRDQLKAMGAP